MHVVLPVLLVVTSLLFLALHTPHRARERDRQPLAAMADHEQAVVVRRLGRPVAARRYGWQGRAPLVERFQYVDMCGWAAAIRLEGRAADGVLLEVALGAIVVPSDALAYAQRGASATHEADAALRASMLATLATVPYELVVFAPDAFAARVAADARERLRPTGLALRALTVEDVRSSAPAVALLGAAADAAARRVHGIAEERLAADRAAIRTESLAERARVLLRLARTDPSAADLLRTLLLVDAGAAALVVQAPAAPPASDGGPPPDPAEPPHPCPPPSPTGPSRWAQVTDVDWGRRRAS
jgi:hypothetical protein